MAPGLEPSTLRLVDILSQHQDAIFWADEAAAIFQSLQDVYKLYSGSDEPQGLANSLLSTLSALERGLRLQLFASLSCCHGYRPLCLTSIQSQMSQLEGILRECPSLDLTGEAGRQVSHQSAEIQTSLAEHGMCHTEESVYDVDEAVQRLQVVTTRLRQLQGQMETGEPADVVVTLRGQSAILAGLQQSMTDHTAHRVRGQLTALSDQLLQIEARLLESHLQRDSPVLLAYLASQHLLRKPHLSDLLQKPSSSHIVNSHMIHPGTRSWILDRIQRWLYKSDDKLFYLAGKEGSGKSALASAVVKLHDHQVMSYHLMCGSDTTGGRNTVAGVVLGLAREMCWRLPEYLNLMDDDLQAVPLPRGASWRQLYKCLLCGPLQKLYGTPATTQRQQQEREKAGHRNMLLVIDGLDQLQQCQWADMKELLTWFCRDLPSCRLLVTAQSPALSSLVPLDLQNVQGMSLEDRAWVNRHIKDIEIYLSSSVGAILSGEDERETPNHARVDETTLQTCIDDMLKTSAGRFDFAIQQMETFAQEMASSGQFLSSLKRSLQAAGGNTARFEENVTDFSSPYRAYRDKEGRSVNVRVMRQSHYPRDKIRVALIRGRHMQGV